MNRASRTMFVQPAAHNDFQSKLGFSSSHKETLEDILQHEGGQGYAGDPSVKGTIINQITGGTKCHDNPPHKYKTENR